MNVSFLHKKLIFLLPTIFLWLAGNGLYAQTVLEVYHVTVLKNGSDSLGFEHYGLSFEPQKTRQPAHGIAKFNPAKPGTNGEKGIKGTPASNKIRYTPTPGFVGLDTVEILYQKQGSNYNSVDAHIIIHYVVVPSFLYAENDYATTPAGQPIEIDVLANDFGSGTNQTVADVPNVNNGSAVKSSNNMKVTFTPAPGFTGVAHLNYTICDAQGSCDMATVSICVLENQPPAYDSIFITTKKNEPQVILLPLNGNYTMILPPSHGDTLHGDVLTYIPDFNYTGLDKIIFEDATANRVRVVQIKVLNAPSENVFLFDQVVFTPANEPIEEINVLANANGSSYLPFVGLVSGSGPANGVVTFVSTGKYSYTPNPGFSGIDQFTFKAKPLNGSWEYAKCYVVVGNQNPALPVFHMSTPKNTPLVLGDHLPFLNYEYSNFSATGNGSLGTISYHPGLQNVTLPSPYGQAFSGYNMLVYKPNAGVTGTDEFEFNYCPGSQVSNCPLVKVIIDIVDIPSPQQSTLCAGRECVWSGDANHDGTVDVRDILPIGLCMGEVGNLRTNGSIAWYGQYANNWSSLFGSLGFNAKHVDTDGNGIISSFDTTAIGQFYGHYNNLTPAPSTGINDLPFYIEEPNLPPTLEPGDVFYAPIHLGNANFPAMDAYGLTFGIDYDPALFESVKIYFSDTAWMNYNSPILSMTHKPFPGKLDAGYTRTSGLSASGHGVIGVLEFIVIDDVLGGRLNKTTTTINLRPMGLMNGNGQTLGLNGNSITLNIGQNSEQTEVTDAQLKVYPNPASRFVSVHLNGMGNEMERVEMYNVIGSKVFDSGEVLAKRMQVDVTSLPAGMYIMKAYSKGEVLTTKVEVMK